jgi:hypothetical protein
MGDSDDSEDGSSSDSSDSDSGSSSSGFGGRKKKDTPKKMPSKKRASSASRPSSSKKQKTGEVEAPAAGPAASGSGEAVEVVVDPKMFDGARSALQKVLELNAASLWRGTFKTKEIENRIKAAVTKSTLLENNLDENNKNVLEPVIEELNQAVQDASAMNNGVDAIREAKNMDEFIRSPHQLGVLKCLALFDHDSLAAVLMHCGTKLIEATSVSRNVNAVPISARGFACFRWQ